MYVGYALHSFMFVCAAILHFIKLPCILCNTIEPATNQIMQQTAALYSAGMQETSLSEIIQPAVSQSHSSSMQEYRQSDTLQAVNQGDLAPSFSRVSTEHTATYQDFSVTSDLGASVGLHSAKFTFLTPHITKASPDIVSTPSALLLSTEVITISASPQHTQDDSLLEHDLLPAERTDNLENESSDRSRQTRSTETWYLEQVTAVPQRADLRSATSEPFSGSITVTTSSSYSFSSWTFNQEDEMTTTPDMDSNGDSLLQSSSSAPDALTVVRLDDSSGYITTPGFQEGTKYPRYLNDTYCLSFGSSEGQTLVLSFQHFELEESSDCRYDYLVLSQNGGSNAGHEIWKKCGTQSIPYSVFNQSDVCLQFVSDISIQLIGFKALYSVLPRSSEEYQLDNGFFNCSAISYSQRSTHFDCNFAIECSDRQDEMNCSYSSPECPGLIDSGSHCYTNIPSANITWAEARKECRRLNQTLASPHTAQEWQNFTRVMSSNSLVAFVGLHLTREFADLSSIYSHTWEWDTSNTAFHFHVEKKHTYRISVPACTLFIPRLDNSTFQAADCLQRFDAVVVCQGNHRSRGEKPGLPTLSQQNTTHPLSIEAEVCTAGFLVQDFLSCDQESRCHDDLSQEQCLAMPNKPNIELFVCELSGLRSVHYTLVCDFQSDCADSSDESFCIHDICPEDVCRNGQCLKYTHRCDGVVQCADESDENCPSSIRVRDLKTVPPPAMITFDGKGNFKAVPLNDSDSCPETHFQCQDLFCLPSYLRCNGVKDCTDHEDEHTGCETASCPGFFRCRRSRVCVHPENVCDGVFHCPQHDDEMLCDMKCPQNCTCQGLAFVCTSLFSLSLYPHLRYLEINEADVSAIDLSQNTYLVFLRLLSCGLKSVDKGTLSSLRNLRTLDLRKNALAHVDLSSFLGLSRLLSLVLSENQFQFLKPASEKIQSLKELNLSHTQLFKIDNTTLATFPSVEKLNLSNSALTTVASKAFSSTADLRVLDLRGTPLRVYPQDMLRFLSQLKEVQADDFRLCCKAALPEFFPTGLCHAPQDSIASCDDLLRSKLYRVFLWIVASTAIIGNAGSFVTRCFVHRKGRNHSSFAVFVTNLSLADFLMGVYLVIVGVADFVLQGQYWWQADSWRGSRACKAAGFLSLLSSEVSAFFISLITLDRFLVLRFPFSRVHFSRRSTLVACAVAWVVGLILAAVPALPWTEHWNFYGQTGICIPLPFTRRNAFKGQMYSFSIIIVLNFVLFLTIALGQASIFCSVRTSSLTQIRKNTKSKDAVIARRLLTIVLSDVLCWCPIGILGLLAYTGTPIHPEISVAVAIFVMPFNSALNPFLYTFNMLMERRLRATEAKILHRLQSRMQSEVSYPETLSKAQTKDSALSQIDAWLQDGLLKHEDLVSLTVAPCEDVAVEQIDKSPQEGTALPFQISSPL